MINLFAALLLGLSALLLKFVYTSNQKSSKLEKIELIIHKDINFVMKSIIYLGLLLTILESIYRLYTSDFTAIHISKTIFLITLFYFLYYINLAKIYFSRESIIYGNGNFEYSKIKEVLWFDSGFSIIYDYKGSLKRYSFMIDMKYKDQINEIFNSKKVKSKNVKIKMSR